jgi:putative inorganic carbon (hco3(-)) transporter
MVLPKKSLNILVFIITLLFIVINSVFVVKESYFLLLAPFILASLYLLVFKLDVYFLILVFLTPLSLELSSLYPEATFDLFLPTEPLVFLAMLVFLAKLVYGNPYPQKFFLHPVSILIAGSILWMLISSLTSTMPLVSFKYLLVRIWFVTVFFFLAVHLFRNSRNVFRFLWLYMIPLSFVIFYALSRHAGYGFFSQKVAGIVVRPFYNDHTAYGAALAMFIPVILSFISLPRQDFYKRFLYILFFAFFVVATLFSYSRATWLSLFIAGFFGLIIALKIRFRTLVFFTVLLLFAGWSVKDVALQRIEKNTQESSSNLYEHIRSISNIRSDASNMERLNRWKSAMAMIRERPVFGWGPGTYMFQYAPYQKSYDRTIISTNFGDIGNVHSEYLGPLVESGVLGAVFFIAIVIWSFLTGLRVYQFAKNRIIRRITLGLLVGLTTYFVHGFLNNFLDTDKASVPFWGFMAILVAFDLRYVSRKHEKVCQENILIEKSRKNLENDETQSGSKIEINPND